MNPRVIHKSLLGMFAALAIAATAHASVQTYGFTNISNNSGVAGSVASQLFVDVWDKPQANSAAFTSFYNDLGGFESVSAIDIGAASVLFVFRNNVGTAANIAEVYFDDGTLLAQSGVYNSISGFTDFAGGSANPSDLPGGNTVGFTATTAFSADVAPGPPGNGVDVAADLLGLSYTLQGVQTYNDTIASLASGDLRIGLHVRSIGTNSESDAFVNGAVIPEACSIVTWTLLCTVGLIGVRLRRR